MCLYCYQTEKLESALASSKQQAADTAAKLEATNRQQQEEVNLCRVMLVRK
jgi:hypothetical protein